jgi:hypothetical protein
MTTPTLLDYSLLPDYQHPQKYFSAKLEDVLVSILDYCASSLGLGEIHLVGWLQLVIQT